MTVHSILQSLPGYYFKGLSVRCVPWLSVLCYVVKCTILCIVVLVYLENSIRSFSSCLTSFMGATDQSVRQLGLLCSLCSCLSAPLDCTVGKNSHWIKSNIISQSMKEIGAGITVHNIQGVPKPRTSSRKSVLSKPHLRNRSGFEFSKLSMQFFKL